MDYYAWQPHTVSIGGEEIRYAAKAGLPATLWSERLLAESIEAQAGERAIVLNGGCGLAGVVLMKRGVDVTMFDDNVVAVEAAQRTLALNGLSGKKVYAGEANGQDYDLALLIAPKGREAGRRLVARAVRSLRVGGRLYVAGANRAGVKSLIDDAGQIIGSMDIVRIKAAQRVALGRRREASPSLPETRFVEKAAQIRGQTWRYVTRPGVFSWEQLDEGTRILIEALRLDQNAVVLDLGCGCGVVGLVASTLTQHVISVDASALAVEATQRTYELNGVRNADVCLSDCASAVLDKHFDVVVTNPPFHQGVDTDKAVARQFVIDAAKIIKPGGELWLVANRFLRYERELADRFAAVRVVYEDNRYRVCVARR